MKKLKPCQLCKWKINRQMANEEDSKCDHPQVSTFTCTSMIVSKVEINAKIKLNCVCV